MKLRFVLPPTVQSHLPGIPHVVCVLSRVAMVLVCIAVYLWACELCCECCAYVFACTFARVTCGSQMYYPKKMSASVPSFSENICSFDIIFKKDIRNCCFPKKTLFFQKRHCFPKKTLFSKKDLQSSCFPKREFQPRKNSKFHPKVF